MNNLVKAALSLLMSFSILSGTDTKDVATIAEPVTGTFTTAAMNVDGLPAKIVVDINPDGPDKEGTTKISQKIATKGWDVIGVSEDFNFHHELMTSLYDNYNCGTHRGGVSITNTNTDGLNLIYKNTIQVEGEKCIPWKVKYSTGFLGTGNGADKLVDKGYRFYQVTVAEGVTIDYYILHMDAASDPEDIAAREAELDQLVEAIKASNNKNPIIVMGDTNCRYTREKLEEKFINTINADSRFTINDCWIEKCKNGVYPTYGSESLMVGTLGYVEGEIVDKIFYINNTDSDVTLTLNSFKVDTDFNDVDGTPLADHYPVVSEFTYTKQVASHTHSYNPVVTNPTCTQKGYTTYTCECGDSYVSDEIDALGHDYKVTVEDSTCTKEGLKTYVCTRCQDSYTENITMKEHSYKATVTAPTCTNQGYTTHTCNTCNDSYKDTYTAALGHDYVDGFCSRCNEKDPNYLQSTASKVLGEEVTEFNSNKKYSIIFEGSTGKYSLNTDLTNTKVNDIQLSDNQIWNISEENGTIHIYIEVNGVKQYLKPNKFVGYGYNLTLSTTPYNWKKQVTTSGLKVYGTLGLSTNKQYLRYYNAKYGWLAAGSSKQAPIHIYEVK